MVRQIGNFYSGTDAGGNNLVVTDGTVTNWDVEKIIVSAGTITASSGKSVTITTGGGGGGGSWTITDGTTSQTISDGDTLTVSDGGGVTATVSATDTLTLGTDGVLEDLNTLDAATVAGQFIVATAAGEFQYQIRGTAQNSLGIYSGFEAAPGPPGGQLNGGQTSFTIANTNIQANSVVLLTPQAPGATSAITCWVESITPGVNFVAVINNAGAVIPTNAGLHWTFINP